MVRIGLGIVEFLDRRLVWFELLADPVSYLQKRRLPPEAPACMSLV